ncbi:MAG: hypothetical protein HC836_39220 [Richelia sp. RM2_1_2]|nr:hypothetical protein [Richelia sp. RM2_1_2]
MLFASLGVLFTQRVRQFAGTETDPSNRTHRESWQVGICRECNRRVQPVPAMSVMVSKNKTGLGSLVGK